MRLFISIEIPQEIKKEIEKIQNCLPEFQGKKTEFENLHLTLKFLGEVSENKLNEIKSALSQVKCSSFETKIYQLGFFSPSQIRIIWLSMSNCEILQKEIDEKLSNIFSKEKRFMSHLTIARIKEVENKKRFIELINKINIPEMRFQINHFNLMQSYLKSSGPEYKILEKFNL